MSTNLRMPYLNTVTVSGRLGADPDLKFVANGKAVATFNLAVSMKFKTKEGDTKEKTLWVKVETWDKLAEYVKKAVGQGRPVIVSGSLKQDEWDDKATGQKRRVLFISAQSVQLLDWDGDGKDGQGSHESKPVAASGPSHDQSQEPPTEDDIPF